jgi:hypothetical protein
MEVMHVSQPFERELSAISIQLLLAFPSSCLQKVLGGTGILPVRRPGWKPVPPMPFTGHKDWLADFCFC